MNGRCGACQWWQHNERPFDTGWGVCGLISEDSSIDGQGGSKTSLACAAGHEVGEGALMTKATFGCILFEPINQPAAWVGEGSLP